MIKFTSILSDIDWKNLGGNEVYVTMLRNKVKVEIPKITSTTPPAPPRVQTTENSAMLDVVMEYLNEVPEDLVYYNIEDVYGHKTIYVYFLSPIDKENFYHYYNMQSGIEEVTK